jgi:FkbM family methyltransferase
MTLRDLLRRGLRSVGLEVGKFKHANVEEQLVARVLHLTEAKVVLDVGANIGQFGALIWSAGFDGTLVSFEAIGQIHERLRARAASSGRRWLVAPRAALGSSQGEIELNISENTASSSVLPMLERHSKAAPESRYVAKEKVPLERLDRLAANIIPSDGELLIKVDTQGYEMEVLKGAAALLPRTSAIQVELSLVPLYQDAPTFTEMLSFVQSRGYQLFGMVPEFVDRRTGQLLQVDAFFVRHDRLRY